LKLFVKSSNPDRLCFGYLTRKNPRIRTKKLMPAVFAGPKIRQLAKDSQFAKSVLSEIFSRE
jgi:hypothetical protein